MKILKRAGVRSALANQRFSAGLLADAVLYNFKLDHKFQIPPNPHSRLRNRTMTMLRRSITILVPLLLSGACIAAFRIGEVSLIRPRNHNRRNRSTIAFASQARGDSLESQRNDALATLDRMDALEESIRTGGDSLSNISQEIDKIEENVKKLSAALLPPPGLTMDEYEAAIVFFLRLPLPMRLSLCKALNISETEYDWTQTPEIVSRLYKERLTLTPKRLSDSYKDVQNRMALAAEREDDDMKNSFVVADPGSMQAQDIVAQLFDGKSEDEVRRENYVKQHLGRVTRKEDVSVSAQELEVLMGVLDSSTFVPNGKPETIPGGYIVRGRNTKSSGKELIEALDAKLPSEWSAQVSLMSDFTEEGNTGSNEPLLVLLKNDFAPTTSRWILSFSTAAACCSAFLFAVGCFGSNDLVTQRLQDMTAVGDYSGLNWFNGLLAQMLFPLVAIQGAHELGHLVVAWRDKIKIAPPTLLPFWVLPFMGAQTQLKTSPKSLTSLFDFAFMGPLLGFVASVAFLLLGLQETLVADSAALQYFPSLPASVLQLSTLGGTIVDAAFGGTGVATLQTGNVPLHPFSIAGFCGIMISALEMLPLGSTDGGRISQALFGRQAHSVVGGLTWFLLLCSTFLLDQSDILLGAWAVNNIAQNDMEVPCRDETDKVDVLRGIAAFAMYFVAALALTPMSYQY